MLLCLWLLESWKTFERCKMRVLSLIIVGLMLSNCSNSYVKNKKTITSPDDLMKFTNVWCEKQKQTNNTIKMCGQGWLQYLLFQS